MLRKLFTLAAFALACSCFGQTSHAQYGGVQVRVGGYGTNGGFGGLGYGNGYGFGFGNGYGSGYGNGFGNGYGNGYRYGNGYPSGYGYNRQSNSIYRNAGNYNSYGYRSYPTMSYGMGTRQYNTPAARRYMSRRFR